MDIPKLLKWIGRLIAALVGIYAWIEFFYRPIEAYTKQRPFSLSGMAAELWNVHSSIYGEVPLAGYVFQLIFVLSFVAVLAALYSCVRWVRIYWDESMAPITVLETSFTLDLTAGLADAYIAREQKYHANRPGQRLYYMRSTANSPTGTIPKSDIHIESRLKSDVITEKIYHWGNSRSWELIERYKNELPTSVFVSLLPNQVVTYLFNTFGFFANIVVQRKSSIRSMKEYDGSEGQFELTALRYPCRKVSMIIKFPNASLPKQLHFYVIRGNAVDDLGATPDTNATTTVYKVELRNFANASLRALWEN